MENKSQKTYISALKITLMTAVFTAAAAAGSLYAGYLIVADVINEMHRSRAEKQLSMIQKEVSNLEPAGRDNTEIYLRYFKEYSPVYFGDFPVIFTVFSSSGELLYMYSQLSAEGSDFRDAAGFRELLLKNYISAERILYPENVKIAAFVSYQAGKETAARAILSVAGIVTIILIIIYILIYIITYSKIERPVSSLTIIKNRLDSIIQQMISGRRIDTDSLLSLEIKHLDPAVRNAILSPMYVLSEAVNRRIYFEKYVKSILAEENVNYLYKKLYEYVNEIFRPDFFAVLEMNHSLNRLETMFSSEGSEKSDHATGDPSQCPVVKTFQPVSFATQSVCCSCFPCKDGYTSLCLPAVAGGQIIGVVMMRFGDETVSEVKRIYGDQLSPDDITDLIRSGLSEYVYVAGLASGNIRMMQLYKNQAVTDNLTGLYNRRYLIETLTNYMALARRKKGALSVIMIDIDHFKKFNDEYGHATGDAVLKVVGKTIKNILRDSDIVGRYGGEEFIVILPDTLLNEAAEVAEKIRKTIAETDYSKWDLQSIPSVTVSLGIAEFPVHGYSYYHLVNSADRALYLSKQNGRNRVTLHSHVPPEENMN